MLYAPADDHTARQSRRVSGHRAGCKYSKAVYGKWVGLISPCVQREHNVFTESTIGMGSLSVGEALGKPALSKRTARDGTVARLRPTPCR